MLQRAGAIVAGKYRLEKPLARGGVGTVWVAKHIQLGNPVAVKFLDPKVASSPQVRTRFEREARAAATLRTPHIVQVFDYGMQGDAPYIAMELLQGETLHARLRKVKRLSLADAYRVIVQIGKGLKRAHDVGFVHRDLKPANIYLARHGDDDDDEVVKILDFGIAKETNSDIGESTKTGELVGSPHFMSPEQIRGEREVDARSDLWALGVILFKAITGELPFPGEVLTAVITRIVVDPLPSARAYVPEAPEALDAFFAKALARDRSQRFQSVRELVQAFGDVAALDAGVQSAGALSPMSVSGTYRAPAPSTSDAKVPSIIPSSIPGSIPGTPLPSMSEALRPPPVPSISEMPPSYATPTAISGGAEPRPPLPSVPNLITTPSAPPPPSAGTLTAAGTEMPPAAPQTGRRSVWIVALGAVAMFVLGGLFAVIQLRPADTPEGARPTTSAGPAAAPSATSVAAPASATASAAPTTFEEPSLTAEPMRSVELPEPTAAPRASAPAAPSGKTPRPTPSPAHPSATGTSTGKRPGGKKPVDTID